MHDEYFFNADGELLIVPEMGDLQIRTEFGVIDVTPAEIAVIPRGMVFQVNLLQNEARGYVCENAVGEACTSRVLNTGGGLLRHAMLVLHTSGGIIKGEA